MLFSKAILLPSWGVLICYSFFGVNSCTTLILRTIITMISSVTLVTAVRCVARLMLAGLCHADVMTDEHGDIVKGGP